MDYEQREVELSLIDQYKKTESLSQSHIYKLRPQELALLFELQHIQIPENDGEKRESLIILEKMNYTEGLLDRISTNPDTGIIGDDKDIQRRSKFFGTNLHALPVIKSFPQVWLEKVKDQNIIILFCAATFSLGVALMDYHDSTESDYYTSISIYFAIAFASLIEAFCDYSKEKQYLKILELKQQETCTVFRGQHGTTKRIPYKDLVVGDIIQVEQGMIVPADCMMIFEMDVQADESFYYPGSNEASVKQCSACVQDEYGNVHYNHQKNPNPFLLYGSQILAGYGRAVVLAVGDYTQHSQMTKGQLLKADIQKTDLQKRLEKLADLIGNFAKAVALTVFVLRVFWKLLLDLFNDEQLIGAQTLIDFINIFMVAVTILVVSIPEGLPLAISLAMSFSISKLRQESLIIRKLDSIENMGRIHHVCVGKGGTLTTGKMEVAKWVFNRTTTEAKNQGFRRFNINEVVKDSLIKQAVILNNTCRIQMTEDDAKYVVEGPSYEKCMLNFLFDNDYDVPHELTEREKNCELLTMIPFNPETKIMIVAYKIDDHDSIESEPTVRIIVKGAPEKVLVLCDMMIDENFNYSQLSDGYSHEAQQQYEQALITPLQQEGFTTMTYAYKDMKYNEYLHLQEACHGFHDIDDRKQLISQLILLATFAIRDDVRDGIPEAVSDLTQNKIQVYMVTGDSLETAKKIALDSGIISQEDLADPYCAISGEEFENISGRAQLARSKTGHVRPVIHRDNIMHFSDLHKRIKVIARCSPYHRFCLVAALQSISGRVACTGESIDDVQALKYANVGLCMGHGCNVAKQSSDIIIEEGQFATILRANQWGRNVTSSVRKFIQFQLTINISACVFLVISALILGQTPFAIIQLLWINVVMDIFAALALATEPPPMNNDKTTETAKRMSKTEKIITQTMWKTIFGQVAYQQFILLIFLFFGPLMFSDSYNLWSGYNKDGDSTPQTRHFTFLFALFMYMNLFNELNSRKLGEKEVNIFSNIHHNLLYIVIVIGEFAVVYVMTHYNHLVFSSATIPTYQHWIAVIFGVLSLGVGFGIKQVPNADLKGLFNDIPEDMHHKDLKVVKQLVDQTEAQFEKSDTMLAFDKTDSLRFDNQSQQKML